MIIPRDKILSLCLLVVAVCIVAGILLTSLETTKIPTEHPDLYKGNYHKEPDKNAHSSIE